MKSFVVNQKKFLFANTRNGTAGSAVMFSLIQTVFGNDLYQYRYLTLLLKTANNADLTTLETALNLLSWNAASECRVK